MANRAFSQFQGTLQKGVVTLFAKVTFNASGVATVVTSEVINAATSPVTINPSNGFVGGTVTASGSGEYLLPLQDSYVRLLGVAASVAGGPSVDALVVAPVVTTNSVASQSAPAVGLTFMVLDTNAAPPAVALGSPLPDDCTVLLTVTLANSSAL